MVMKAEVVGHPRGMWFYPLSSTQRQKFGSRARDLRSYRCQVTDPWPGTDENVYSPENLFARPIHFPKVWVVSKQPHPGIQII